MTEITYITWIRTGSKHVKGTATVTGHILKESSRELVISRLNEGLPYSEKIIRKNLIVTRREI